MTQTTHEEDLTPNEVAKLLHKSPACVRQWILDGKLAATQIGGRYYVKRADAEAKITRVIPKARPLTKTERKRREMVDDVILRKAKIRR